MSMCREFPRSPDSLPVTWRQKHDFFLNTDVTSSFLMLKTSSKNKNDPIYFLGSAQYKINIFLCRNWQKKHHVNYVTMLTKILTCYQ